jgi:glycine/serine hydroxymethyltransferase
MCVSIYTNKCNMQHLNNCFNEFKMDDSTHVTTLIVQKMWKNSLNHSNIIAKHWTTCVSI